MRQFLLIMIIILSLLLFTGICLAGDQCLTCHQGLGDKPSSLYSHDIHFTKGISCAGCHGGNPNLEDMEQAMGKDAGFIGVPKGDDISKACAGCHSNADKMKEFGSSLPNNQWQLLQTSAHGKLSTSGTEHIAQCTTCHSVHNIVSVKNEASPVYPLNVIKTCTKCHADAAFMRNYNPAIPVDQLEKYKTSVHGNRNEKGDAKTAECASCHGSHDIRPAIDVKSSVYSVNIPSTCSRCHSSSDYMKEYGIATDQYEKFSKSVHGLALLQKRDVAAPACNDCHGNHGATPPGVESISKVCGTCHALNAELFSASPHKRVFDEKKLPECETCHGNHEIIAATDKLLGISPNTVCSKCHHENENPKGFVVAKNMSQLIDSLEFSERNAGLIVTDAEQKGMEISEAKFQLKDIRQSRLQARTMVHSFNEEKFREIVDKGLAVSSAVADEGRQAIDEYYFRRWGLGVATLIITIVGIALYLVIKKIERKQQGKQI